MTGPRSGRGEKGRAGVHDQLERGETGDGEEDGGMGPVFGEGCLGGMEGFDVREEEWSARC